MTPEKRMQLKCIYCRLPFRIHFAWCQESGMGSIKMPAEALSPKAIKTDPEELRWIKPIPASKIKGRR
jgi:hypothetical protein